MADRLTQGPEPLGRPRVPNPALDIVAVAVAVAIALLVVSVGVSRSVRLGPLEMTARVTFGWPGETTVRVPPFGQAHALTHVGPARLVVTVEEVDLPQVERLLARRSDAPTLGVDAIRSQAAVASATVSDVLERETRSLGAEVAVLALMAGAGAAVAAGLVALALRRRWRVVGVAAALAATAVLGSVVLASATYQPAALAEPRLEGALAYVPRLQTVFATRLSRIEELRAQVADVANDLAAYYADPRSISAGGGLPGTFRVLHISDQHLDPVGAELARSLARSYEASLVIDTGDLAITGGAVEAALLPSIVVTSTPVVFVPGNHEAASVLSALSAFENVTVATSETVEVEGFRIVPVPDPAGLDPDIESDRVRVEALYEQRAASLEASLAAGEPPPDIVALHNPFGEQSFVGLTPLILSGHTHSGRLYRNGETIRLNSGTTGGMPYDPVVTGRDRLPHGASVLYFTAELPRRLIAIDRIEVGVDGTTELDRTIVDQQLVPPAL